MTEQDDLQTKARIATDLFEKGAARVKITGTDIEVDWREYTEVTKSLANPVSQTVIVNVSSSSKSSSYISQKIRNISDSIDSSPHYSKKSVEAKKQLQTLENELEKPKPQWKVAKKVLQWALDFGKEVFLKIALLVAERYMKQS